MVKLRAPDGISSIVHNGTEIPVANDRSVEVDSHSAQVLKTHGFRAWASRCSTGSTDAVNVPDSPQSSDERERDLSTLKRPALFAYLRAKGISVSLPVTNDELRAMARRASAG